MAWDPSVYGSLRLSSNHIKPQSARLRGLGVRSESSLHLHVLSNTLNKNPEPSSKRRDHKTLPADHSLQKNWSMRNAPGSVLGHWRLRAAVLRTFHGARERFDRHALRGKFGLPSAGSASMNSRVCLMLQSSCRARRHEACFWSLLGQYGHHVRSSRGVLGLWEQGGSGKWCETRYGATSGGDHAFGSRHNQVHPASAAIPQEKAQHHGEHHSQHMSNLGGRPQTWQRLRSSGLRPRHVLKGP